MKLWYVTIDQADGASFEVTYWALSGRLALDRAARDYNGEEIVGMGASERPSEDWNAIIDREA